MSPALDSPLLALLLPVLALLDVALAHYHLHQKLEPDRAARIYVAIRKYGSALVVALSAWALLQTTLAILFNLTNPLLPAALGALAGNAYSRFVQRVPGNWRQQPPLLSEDKSYHAFLKLVAERAAEVKAKPERKEQFLKRLYADDEARIKAIGQYLGEHRGNAWIPLKPHQLAYHPGYFRLPATTLYLAALLPVIVPFLLGVFTPEITEQNLSFTLIASALASMFYGSLFDPIYRPVVTAIAVAIVLSLVLATEFARFKFLTPGLVGILALLMFGVVMLDYIQTYVVERTDTPLLIATNYVLGYLQSASSAIDRAENLRWLIEQFLGEETMRTIRDVDQLVAAIRSYVLAFQSRVGALFIVPALLFWGSLTYGVLWELHFSRAAQVSFHNRMRKPLI